MNLIKYIIIKSNMEINILGENYDINLKILKLTTYELDSLPVEICNLRNLKGLYLSNNQLQSLPVEILKIKNILKIYKNSYCIDNIKFDNEIIIFTEL